MGATLRGLGAALVLAASLALAVGCDGPAPADAGVDGGADGGRADAGRDAGPLCTAECEPLESCCREPDGTSVCVTLRNDPRHCGLCQIDCVASHRGDRCSANQCACGATSLGCVGNRQSWCCPPLAAGSVAYCADLDRSPADCGACGVGCNAVVSDRCDGGRCVCGNSRGPCDGGPTSVCCTSGADVGCVNLTNDRFNCGACNRLCAADEQCRDGVCTTGETSCPGGCEGAAICCNGSCCERGRCIGGVCGGP